MNYREALAWLFGTQRFGIKLGLENVERLFAELKVPAPEQRIIHVAGTNGKGSVCAMIDSILRAGGYRSGLFTSPHLVTFRERIQLDGEMISEDEVAAGLTSLRERLRDYDPHPTFFEIVTALALQYFRRARCELIVLETGMGGRLDATNAVTPVVSVITPIDYDHQKWLGHSLGKIAREKAGIIKPGVPVISAPQRPDAEAVIRARAAECEAPLRIVTSPYDGKIGLAGEHQRQNAAVAVATMEAANIAVDAPAIRDGLTNVRWPARFQRWNDRLIIDGAHNPAGARVLAQAWRRNFGDARASLVFGVFQDKNVAEIFHELADIAADVVLPIFRGERVMPPDELVPIIASIRPQLEIGIATSCADALQIAQNKRERVLVAGSLHLAGEMLSLLQGRPTAFEECAQ